MKFVEYTFKEFVNSDFWNNFYKVNRDGFEYLQCPESRIVLGAKNSAGEKFDDIFSFYYNFGRGEWDKPKYVKVAECSEQQVQEDLSVSIVDVRNTLFIMIPEVKCKKAYPGYPQGFFIPLMGEWLSFVEEYNGLNYEDNLEESKRYLLEGNPLSEKKLKIYLDSKGQISFNKEDAKLFESKREAEKVMKSFLEKKKNIYEMNIQEEIRRTRRVKEDNGWSEEIQASLEDLLDDFDRFSYEIRNGVRGVFTGVLDVEGLKKSLIKLSEECLEVANNLSEKSDDTINYDEMSDEELEFLGYNSEDEAFNPNPASWDDLKNL